MEWTFGMVGVSLFLHGWNIAIISQNVKKNATGTKMGIEVALGTFIATTLFTLLGVALVGKANTGAMAAMAFFLLICTVAMALTLNSLNSDTP